MKHFACAIATLALMTGCAKQNDAQFLGSWVNVKSDKRTVLIEKNGGEFMIRETGPSFISGKVETRNIPATMKNGMLEVQTGFGTDTLAVDKATGHLTNGQLEYRRVK
jgi:hypothetical protein